MRTERLNQDRAEDQRSVFQRDRDRLLYCSALRRLAGVTQVVSSAEGHVFHNRLTHTLKVAQIARRLAEKLGRQQPEQAATLGGIDPDVAEAAALAHDLGHPPFGHIAEHELDTLATQAGASDGFEGNAQSFRIVTKLAIRHLDHAGLNLTKATLNAILKYPWFREPAGQRHRKWGVYHAEDREFRWARSLFGGIDDARKSVEAALMDWSDDIAYSVHDVEDFYRAGLVPLDRLVVDDDEVSRFLDSAFERWRTVEGFDDRQRDTFAKILDGLRDTIGIFLISEPFRGTSQQRAGLRSFTSNLVARYIDGIQLQVPTTATEPRVKIDARLRDEVRLLKELVWYYVINNPALATQQYGQRQIISKLFDVYLEAAQSENMAIFPARGQEELRAAKQRSEVEDRRVEQVRIVVDMISAMTESQAIKLYQRFTGGSFGSITDAIHLQ